MPRRVRPEVLALLADVKENPDDLTPWLVLTDWLEENGDEADRARAEYCRLCFDKLGKKTYASDWEKGERRRELFRTWKVHWLGALVQLQQCTVKRGLLHIHSDSERLIQAIHHGIPLEAGAWVENLDVYHLAPSHILELARSPLLEGPVVVQMHIDWNGSGAPEAFLALAKSPYLKHVRELRIPNGHHRLSVDVFAPLKQRFGAALKVKRR